MDTLRRNLTYQAGESFTTVLRFADLVDEGTFNVDATTFTVKQGTTTLFVVSNVKGVNGEVTTVNNEFLTTVFLTPAGVGLLPVRGKYELSLRIAGVSVFLLYGRINRTLR